MTVKVKVGDIEGIVSKQLEKAVSASLDKELAQDVANQIKKRTQLGFGVDENGKQFKLNALSDSYKAQRKGEVAFFTDQFGNVIPYEPEVPPNLSRNTTPSKSNLTKTGEMLESLTGEVSDNQILINVKGLRKDGSGLTNEEVKDFVEAQGRTFLSLTSGERKELAREIKNRILRNL